MKWSATLLSLFALSVAVVGAPGQPTVGLPESGYAWATSRGGATAMVVAESSTAKKGELFLWHSRLCGSNYRCGSFQHVRLPALASPWGMQWSPNGRVLALEVESRGQRVLCCATVGRDGAAAHVVGEAKVVCKAWSPNSRYLAFAEEFGTRSKLRCLPRNWSQTKVMWTADQVFDLVTPAGLAAKRLQWSPGSDRILAAAWRREAAGEPGWYRVSEPGVFVAYPLEGRKPVLIWQDRKLKQRVPDARWADGGRKIVFALVAPSPAYNIPQSLHVVNADGTGLRKLWGKDFARFLVRGKTALVWLLPDPSFDCPEPTRMAAFNLTTAKMKLYEDGTFALEPECLEQEIRWSADGRSVSLVVEKRQQPGKRRRVTLALP